MKVLLKELDLVLIANSLVVLQTAIRAYFSITNDALKLPWLHFIHNSFTVLLHTQLLVLIINDCIKLMDPLVPFLYVIWKLFEESCVDVHYTFALLTWT